MAGALRPGQVRQFTERLAALAPVVFQPGPALAQLALQAPLLLEEAELGGRRFGRGVGVEHGQAGQQHAGEVGVGDQVMQPDAPARTSSAAPVEQSQQAALEQGMRALQQRCDERVFVGEGADFQRRALLGLPVDDQFETFRAAVHLAVEQRELFAQAPSQARQVGCRHLGRSQVAEAEAGQVGAEQLAEDHPAGPGRQVDAQGLRGLIRHRLVPQAVALGGGQAVPIADHHQVLAEPVVAHLRGETDVHAALLDSTSGCSGVAARSSRRSGARPWLRRRRLNWSRREFACKSASPRFAPVPAD